MDLYDKKIINLLIKNCRYSLIDIAKAVNLSKDSVKYRINRLEKQKIITGFSLMIDPRQFGYFVNHLLLKLKTISEIENQDILKKLKEHPNITFISSQSGTFDMQIIFHTKTIYKKNQILEEILSIFKDLITNYKEVTHIRDYSFSFLFSDIDVNISVKEKNDSSFSKLIEKNKKVTQQIPQEIINYDKIDREIIKAITKNPREKLNTIAEKIGINNETVKNRIKSLIKKKAIYRFSLYPNHSQLDLFNYMLLFKIEILPKEIEKKLNNFLENSIFILYAAKFNGAYNLFIYILAKNPNEFTAHLNELKNILDDYIIEYDLSILTQIHKFQLISDDLLIEK
ncbi:MAG: AsnC family transcriptional regulator [Nanoarchaeota archaeon]|nr:AsnC family transcriptional regulator [Nanoarchaeota archaeon]